MNKKQIKPVPLPVILPLDDAVVRVPGRAMGLVRLAMMHDPTTRGIGQRALLGIICIEYAERVIADHGVRVPAHLSSRANGVAR